MERFYLVQDVFSMIKKQQCYGRQGEEVEIIDRSGHVVGVRNLRNDETFFTELVNLTTKKPEQQPGD